MKQIPGRFNAFMSEFPEIGSAYASLGGAVAGAGPLEARERELVKVGICIGAGLEGATHSHVRKALEAGVTPEELRHAAIQATTTIGFPTMMRGLGWVEEAVAKYQGEPER